MQHSSTAALLRAAVNDARCAERLLVAQTARDLFPDAHDARVLRALVAVLEATGHRSVRPALVAELMGPDAPAWLTEPLRSEVTDFAVHLRVAIARHDTGLLVKMGHGGTEELRLDGELADETKNELRRLLDLPAPGQVAARRNTGFRAVALRNDGQSHLVHTGFASLDRQMSWDLGAPIGTPGNRFPGGYGAGNLVVVGAESGTGKTTFSIEMALRSTWLFNQVNGTERSLIVFSEEQSADEIVARAGMKYPRQFWRQRFDEAGYEAFFLDSTDYGKPTAESVISMTVELVRETVAKAKDEGLPTDAVRSRLPLVVVVDYAKLFAATGMPLVQGIDALARSLKGRLCRGQAFQSLALAELEGYQPAVVLPTQVMRPKVSAKERSEWRPTNDDLADCRAIRDHADMVLLLYRDTDVTQAAITKARRGIAQSGVWTNLHAHGGRWYDSAEEADTLRGPPTERYREFARQSQEARRAGERAPARPA